MLRVRRVNTRTSSFRYSAEPLTSVIGVADSTAASPASDIRVIDMTLPWSTDSAARARTGVGATEARAIRTFWTVFVTGSICRKLDTPATAMSISLRGMNRRYADFKDSILLAVANFPDVQAQKIGDGSFGTSGVRLVDALFKSPTGSFSVSTFAAGPDYVSDSGVAQSIRSYIRSLAVEIAKGTFSRALLAFDRDANDEPEFATILADLETIAKGGITAKFVVVSGDSEHVIEAIAKAV